jgi:D-tyrosyl-tRNA(Tyr) deacylase
VRVLVQRVARAAVRVADGAGGERVTGAIGRGLLVLVGLTHADTEAELAWMADKVVGLRVFADAEGRMNLGAGEAGGALLVVSQFTLYGDAGRGRRPSYGTRRARKLPSRCTRASWRCCARGARRSRRGSSGR